MTTDLEFVPNTEVEAHAIAGEETYWVQSDKLVCTEAMRIQFARLRTVRGVARWFRIDATTVRKYLARGEWGDMSAEAVAELSLLVRRAMSVRRGMLGGEANEPEDELAFTWPPSATPSVAAPSVVLRAPPSPALPGQDFPIWSDIAHPAQEPPADPWRVWMMMGGRGAGKTRAGAEWVRGLVESGKAKRIALVGPTLHDVREVMIEGPSGLCTIAPAHLRPKFEATRRRLVWPPGSACEGAVAYAFSAEDPDSLRGPQFDAAWCDEIGAWAKDVKTWEVLAFGMRLGDAPRIMATTTPRPRALVKLLAERAALGRGGVVTTRASTRANAANLSPDFVAALEEDYARTALARQELDGELIEDLEGALWSRAMIEAARVDACDAEGLERIVVAVDPPAGASGRSDACGIIVAGVKDRVVHVLHDATVRGLKPDAWAERVIVTALAFGARTVVAESNQGGEMVRAVLEHAGAKARGVGVKLEHATVSKRERAEPVSTLYARGRVRHARVLKELEDEMCAFGAPDAPQRSPDRVDALVWAVGELTRKVSKPRLDQL